MFFEKKIFYGILIHIFLLASPGAGHAVSAGELLVVFNERMAGSEEIAEYYIKMRNIPRYNLLAVSLGVGESMKRGEYEQKLRKPVIEKIASLKGRSDIYGIVLIYGVPLKVQQPAIDEKSKALVKELRELQKTASKEHKKQLRERVKRLTGADKRASVDSELMLAKVESYKLSSWIKNPYYVGFNSKELQYTTDDVLLVARLDGPDKRTVLRIIDDVLAVEQTGLEGRAYFDARWASLPKQKNRKAYGRWDNSLHEAAKIVEKRMPVTLDTNEELFAPGTAPDAALYCGWYSLSNYVDSFTWSRGAVGYHMASGECTTLRRTERNVWCLQMLTRGVAATLGPVAEPYIQAFPLPELFFKILTEGYMNLGETYLVSLPFISWQMVLVGDPLYKPFRPLSKQDGTPLVSNVPVTDLR
ncbi:TIGR03790 family protein [Desulfosediminicola sp.]|uniref:TIGR03790 family protein n=1 Tax=Desulfosediminicola sp. TaxID=2886825 RepID=UPI003AF2A914